MTEHTYTLLIHGGAGDIDDPGPLLESMRTILEHGTRVLAGGGNAVDAVTTCVQLLEDDALFNAGRGSVLNYDGKVEADAAIMDGRDLGAGAVAGVTDVKNPISLARTVMEQSGHVFLVGSGAERFARENDIAAQPADYFITEARQRQWNDARSSGNVTVDHADAGDNKYGTVGAVACDRNGDLAAATSTGGLVNKRYGRVGDSPIVGAGVYADNETCAVSATGYGEQFIRTALSKSISDAVSYRGVSAQDAADDGIAYLVRRVDGVGGVIVVDAHGRPGIAHSSRDLLYGVAQTGRDSIVAARFPG